MTFLEPSYPTVTNVVWMTVVLVLAPLCASKNASVWTLLYLLDVL